MAVEPADDLAAALVPAAAAARFKQLPAARWKSTATFRIAAAGENTPGITTTTDIRTDRQGNYRLIETNDHDGGREIVSAGGELGVALRYGKLIRRPAREPEPSRLLEEGVGSPWAAWEIVRRFASVERLPSSVGGDNGEFRMTKGASPAGPRSFSAEPTAEGNAPLRRWRDSVSVKELLGHARLHQATGALLAFALETRFSALRDGKPIEGALTVMAEVEILGAAAAVEPIVMPMAAEELRNRQRTTLDERALLQGLAPIAAKP
jgi:hypothetical protein